jgi:hypothetical protein
VTLERGAERDGAQQRLAHDLLHLVRILDTAVEELEQQRQPHTQEKAYCETEHRVSQRLGRGRRARHPRALHQLHVAAGERTLGA